MSINNIHLHHQLLADLYPDVLIEKHARAVPEKEDLRFLGSNQKQILVVVENDATPFLPDNELAFLTSVLSACKLGLADVAIVNLNSVEDKENVTEKIDCKNVLLFGVEPSVIGLPIVFPHFQLQQFNKRTYLSAPTLHEIESDKATKLKLWTCLKTLFCI